ncbi:MAG: hypothetical protein IMZ53_14630 [Thermoplasmata archaeon]|nr:hypothetical protein [Thermoplasmata archaeon]
MNKDVLREFIKQNAVSFGGNRIITQIELSSILTKEDSDKLSSDSEKRGFGKTAKYYAEDCDKLTDVVFNILNQ